MNDLMLVSVEEDESVQACMSLNGVCLSTLPEYYGDLTLISREMKMARRFRWISRCGGRNREVTVLPRNSHAVRLPVFSFSRYADGVTDLRVRSPKRERVLRQQWAEAQKVGINISNIQFDKVGGREEQEEY